MKPKIKKINPTANNISRSMNLPIGLLLEQNYFNSIDYSKWIKWLCSLHPIWESRYLSSTTNEISNYVFMSDENRKLLRPVYWMGNWQFACLGYFQLPNGTKNRCMRAEPYPDFVQKKIDQIEAKVKATLPPAFIPRKWHLNTLLINYYGSSIDPETGKKIDQARLGEHKDHEPGPVASLSFGAKHYFNLLVVHINKQILKLYINSGLRIIHYLCFQEKNLKINFFIEYSELIENLQ